MNELERLRQATASYEALQGFRLMPIAFPVAWAGIGGLAGGGLEGRLGLVVFLGSVVAAVIISSLCGRWYAARFGVVHPTAEQRGAMAVRCGLAVGAVVVAALAEWRIDTPVSPLGLVVAGSLALFWHSVGRLDTSHMAATLSLVAVSLLPLAGASVATTWSVLFVAISVVYVVVGVVDHRYLTATLSSTTAEA